MKSFGVRLATLRVGKGLSQAELGKILNIAQSTIAMYEKDKRRPDLGTLAMFAEYFNVSTDYLLGVNKPIISESERKKAEIKKALISLVSHDEGEFPIEEGLVDTVFEHMEKAKEFHAKRKGDQKK